MSSTHIDRVQALTLGIIADVPTILWGLPGEGKTAMIEQIAVDNTLHLETVIASTYEPADFKGMPVVLGDRVQYIPTDWALNLVDAGGGLAFLDELSTAPASVQAALLRVVLAKRAGSVQLPSATRFVAAANPPEVAADGYELPAPMANRFMHIEHEVDAAYIADGFMFGFNPIPLPALDVNAGMAGYTATKFTVGAFLKARAPMKSVLPARSTEQGMAWPSPRSWDSGAKVLGFARAAGMNMSVQSVVLSGCVGATAALEYLAYEENLDLPDVEEALKTGTIRLPDRPDKVYATMAAIVAAVLQNPTPDRINTALNALFEAIIKAGYADTGVVGMTKIAEYINKHRLTDGIVIGEASMRTYLDIMRRMETIGSAGSRHAA